MNRKFGAYVCLCVILCSLAGCSGKNAASPYFPKKQAYTRFNDMPAYATAEDALKDGCLTIVSDAMIEAVKCQIDLGKPALVWNALTNMECDVV